MLWDVSIMVSSGSIISYAVVVLVHMAELCSAHSPSPSESLIVPLTTQQVPWESIPRPESRIPLTQNISLSITVMVGSPPQRVTMVVDTGSELSWLPCNTSRGKTTSFDPTQSLSYNPVSCDSFTCRNRTLDFTIPASCDLKNLCHATLSYADASSSEGNLAIESFRFGNTDIPEMVFGCMESLYSTNLENDMNDAGLLGMNRGSLSIVSQMALTEFSYCISSTNLPGFLVLGKSNLTLMLNFSYTPLINLSVPLPYFDRFAYTVQMVGIKVSDILLPIPSFVFVPDHTGAGQTMVDSGTQFSFLLGEAYTELRREFLKQTSSILKPLDDPNYVFQGAMDLCYLVPLWRESFAQLPSVSLVFEGSALTIPGERILYQAPGEMRDNCSIYCLSFGNSDLLGVEAYLIGHYHQQNVWVNVDVENSRLGVAEVQCDSETDKLGMAL